MARAAGLALAAALAAGPTDAQTRASLDAGVSYVEYTSYFPSAAFSLAPSLLIVAGRAAFAAHGSWLRFESGNNSFQGLVAGSLSYPASPDLIAELGAEVGGSRYEQFASFFHVLGRGRMQFRQDWIAAMVGAADFGSGPTSVIGLSLGVRHDLRDLTIVLSGAGTAIGDLAYADLGATFRHGRPGGLLAEAVVSARAGDPDNDPGPYVEASLTVPFTTHAAVVLAGGRYAADAVRGNVSGRYVTAAVRLTMPLRPRRRPAFAMPPVPAPEDGATAAVALVEVRRGRGETCTLVFRAASPPEVMGDFTDWVPTALAPAGEDLWSVTLPIPPGRHRLNVRLGGGPWGVPVGATPVADEFLGLVGALVIP